MKNKVLLLFLFASLFSFGQEHFCGLEEAQRELEREFPQSKKERELIEKKIRERGSLEALQEYDFSANIFNQGLEMMSSSSKYQGEIYEIPIVVHVIETNIDKKLTDEQIQQWVENTNRMYATTYGNGFYEEGDGAEGGTVMPFKLVFAKRTPECTATNGIIRYDFSDLESYVNYGIKLGNKEGATLGEIKNRAPHWPEKSYYNIYIVNGINGNKATWGIKGFARYPNEALSNYETVIKTSVVTVPHDITLAHEFGHSLGLYHPFHGSNNAACPTNNDCTIDNDRVCDTEPVPKYPPKGSTISPCTNQEYSGGILRNIMGYSSDVRKFTPGQRERALALFLPLKGMDLMKSRGAKPIDEHEVINLATSCTPSTILKPNNRRGIGVTKVQLRDIDNVSPSSDRIYVDYTQNTCLDRVYTDLPEGEESTFIGESSGQNPQWIKVWIDYNNDGVFEDSEKIGEKVVRRGDNRYELNFTPPPTAVKNTYLRMRVRGDEGAAYQACGDVNTGQIEDYAVRIVPKEIVPGPGESKGRVGINTETPLVTLDIRGIEPRDLPEGTPQGVTFPSFTEDQRSKFKNVKQGTMIYNTTKKCIEIYVDGIWKCM